MDSAQTISEVFRRSGAASSVLRFYEARGLITSERAGSGHRRYTRAVLRQIAFIVFAQKIGLSLEEIGAELAKVRPTMGFRSFWSASVTLAGIELMHMIRKVQSMATGRLRPAQPFYSLAT
jgi:MerR family transcriptional regulator, redox-sensitive transcriptional activator SoxR